MKTKNLLPVMAFVLMLSILTEKAFSQATTFSPTNTSNSVLTDYLGWSTVNNLNFKTGGLQQMTLQTNGHFGIGLTPGSDILDIKPGAGLTNTGLGLFNWTDGFSSTVLHNWGFDNIFVGA